MGGISSQLQIPSQSLLALTLDTLILAMNIHLSAHQTPQMITVKSAVITIPTCFAEEADCLVDLHRFLQVHSHLIGLLKEDDLQQMINWYDGRPKSMFVTICTANQAAIQYAFSHGLLDEERTIEDTVRDYLGSQVLRSDSIEALFDEFITPRVTLRQREGNLLFVAFDGEPNEQ